MIFTSCGAAPHGSGCGGRRATDFAPRVPMAPVGCPGRAIAAAWAPGDERRELWLCHKIWPEIWCPSDYGGHTFRVAIHIRVIYAVRPSCHACRQHSTSLRAMANLVRAPNPVLHERMLTCQRYAGVCGHLRIGDRGNAIVRLWRWPCGSHAKSQADMIPS